MTEEQLSEIGSRALDAERDPKDQAMEQLVVMRLSEEDYGVDITHVREIIRMQSITEVPQAPPYVEGIINLRGSVIPVVDLRKRFDLKATESSETRIVVVDVNEHAVGLVVDGVTEVITVPASSIEPVSNLAAASLTSDLRGIVNLPEKLIILINLESLLETISNGEFNDGQHAALSRLLPSNQHARQQSLRPPPDGRGGRLGYPRTPLRVSAWRPSGRGRMRMDLGLDGRVAIVTGGSEGIGAATARLLAAEGCNVTIGARRPDVLERAAGAIRDATGREPLAVPMDARLPKDCARLVERTVEHFGGVDIIINNAGRSAAARFDTVDDATWHDDLELKLFGAIRMARLCLPSMRERGGGRIINLLNIGAKQPGAGALPTVATRAAGLALSKALSRELAPENILVNAVCIGSVKSAQWSRFRARRAPQASEAEFLAQVGETIPLGRIGETEEAASLIVFLASTRASYITGTAINVDGGASGVW